VMSSKEHNIIDDCKNQHLLLCSQWSHEEVIWPDYNVSRCVNRDRCVRHRINRQRVLCERKLSVIDFIRITVGFIHTRANPKKLSCAVSPAINSRKARTPFEQAGNKRRESG